MADHRLFVSQETAEIWMSEEHIEIEGEIMTLLPAGQKFQLKTAVHFLDEIAGGGDDAGLIGKVKDVEQLAEIGAEHVADSVILDESAYTVVEGFVGFPILDGALAGAPTTDADDNIAKLARFFLAQR